MTQTCMEHRLKAEQESYACIYMIKLIYLNFFELDFSCKFPNDCEWHSCMTCASRKENGKTIVLKLKIKQNLTVTMSPN